jgi:hypothetical protein
MPSELLDYEDLYYQVAVIRGLEGIAGLLNGLLERINQQYD